MSAASRAPGKFGLAAAICALLSLLCAWLHHQPQHSFETREWLYYGMYGLGAAALLAGVIGFVTGENWRANGLGMVIGGGVLLAQFIPTGLSMLLGILLLLAILGSLGIG
jgi:hypothetical protein